ncbi:PREDICTED: protein FAM81B, partial [Myotis davidii]|uniref:protein FAM81B n=1 Tax=Myotis davidii TaxID=225400 RepID=UPI0003EC37F9
KARKSSTMSSNTDINKSVSPTAEEQLDEPDGPLPGSASDQENKVRLSPVKMSTKNSTDLVEYVDKEINRNFDSNLQILEDQIRARDQAATGTNFAVQELNSRHLQGVGDLRGRVARCDASIVKLSGDIHFIRHEYRQIEKTIQELISSLETVSKNLEMKETRSGLAKNAPDAELRHVRRGAGQGHGRAGHGGRGGEGNILPIMQGILQNLLSREVLYPSLKEITGKCPEWLQSHWESRPPEQFGKYQEQRSVMGKMCEQFEAETDAHRQLNSLANNLYEEVEKNQKRTESQLIKYDKDQLGHMNSCLKLLQEKQENSENKMGEKLLQLSSKLENFINTHTQDAALSKVKHIENKLRKKMSQLEKHIWDELEKMQSECQSGFKSIHDSLTSLQQIQKTKMDLEIHKVQKDLKKLHRKIVDFQEV